MPLGLFPERGQELGLGGNAASAAHHWLENRRREFLPVLGEGAANGIGVVVVGEDDFLRGVHRRGPAAGEREQAPVIAAVKAQD